MSHTISENNAKRKVNGFLEPYFVSNLKMQCRKHSMQHWKGERKKLPFLNGFDATQQQKLIKFCDLFSQCY